MQERERRSNPERSAAMRAQLVASARKLFVEHSYAETGTPDIVAAAGVTRGALYHHFADKRALFQAVVEHEAAEVAAEIERAAPGDLAPLAALAAGARAYLDAMAEPGRTRLLLLDGPAVLGRSAMDEIDAAHGNRTLRHGLAAAMRSGALRKLPVEPLTSLLGAMFDRAALAIESGAEKEVQLKVLEAVIAGLAAPAS